MAKGWAELHPLSGVMGRIPLPYVMIYAPRCMAVKRGLASVLESGVEIGGSFVNRCGRRSRPASS